jgi:hypothetical protein
MLRLEVAMKYQLIPAAGLVGLIAWCGYIIASL